MSNTIIDDYELLNCLATGNVSQIWEVKQVSSSQIFAMKLLLPEALVDSDHRAALKHEASVGKRMDHPNIIRVNELKITKKHGYFIMEFFRAPNLKSMIRNDVTGARVRAKKIIECVSQALAYMHEKGYVHRDVKPDNILVNKGSEVRLIDFSLAAPPKKLVGQLLHSKRRAVIPGTRTYLAPELIQREPLGISADIYSLGVTIYEMLTGRPPFISGNPNELLMMHVRDRAEKPSGFNSNVSPEADAFVMSLLEKKPKNRPANMQEVFAAVRNLKLFKIDAEEFARNAAAQAEEDFSKGLSARLDSRVDAGRTDEEKAFVAREAKRITEEKAALMEAARKRLDKRVSANAAAKKPAAAPAAAQPAVQQPVPMYPPGYPVPGQMMPQGYPQMMPPGFPGMPGMMPGMPMPGMYYPQGVMPGMPPGMGMPGVPMPGMGMPGVPMPPAAMPGMPAGAMPPGVIPGGPIPGMPGGPAGGPVPPRPAPPAPKPAPQPPKPPIEDIPLMEELPDVI